MTLTRPNFIAVILTAYWDLGRVLRALRAPALTSFLLYVVVQFAATFFVPLFAQTYIAKMVLIQLIALGSLAVFAPFLVAAHRFILRGEAATIADAATVTPRVISFTGWLLALAAIALLPSLFAIMTRQVSPTYYLVRPQMATGAPRELALFVLTVAVSAVVARMMIMLPAIANDASNVTVRTALADTNGNALYIVLATFLCGIPLTFAAILALTGTSMLPWKAQAFAVYLVFSVTAFIGITLGACIASRIYQAMGDQLDRPAP
jgi:hypothetical protein